MKRHKLNSKASNRGRGMFKGISRKGSSKGGKRRWHS